MGSWDGHVGYRIEYGSLGRFLLRIGTFGSNNAEIQILVLAALVVRVLRVLGMSIVVRRRSGLLLNSILLFKISSHLILSHVGLYLCRMGFTYVRFGMENSWLRISTCLLHRLIINIVVILKG